MKPKSNIIRAIKEMSNYGTYYTNVAEDKLNPPDIRELASRINEIANVNKREMAGLLVGIPLVIDDTLTGGNIKVMISREMYLELKLRAEGGH